MSDFTLTITVCSPQTITPSTLTVQTYTIGDVFPGYTIPAFTTTAPSNCGSLTYTATDSGGSTLDPSLISFDSSTLIFSISSSDMGLLSFSPYTYSVTAQLDSYAGV